MSANNNFDDLINALVAAKEELGDKPASFQFEPDSAGPLNITISTTFKDGKPQRTVIINA